MRIIIVACNINNVIGFKGKIPWNCKEDLAFFKKTTIDKTVVMGRKTFISLNQNPLPERKNVVCSKNHNFKNVENCDNLEDFLKSHNYCYIIGGAQIYEQSFKFCDEIYLSRIPNNLQGDTYFKVPEYYKLYDNVTFNSFRLEKYRNSNSLKLNL